MKDKFEYSTGQPLMKEEVIQFQEKDPMKDWYNLMDDTDKKIFYCGYKHSNAELEAKHKKALEDIAVLREALMETQKVYPLNVESSNRRDLVNVLHRLYVASTEALQATQQPEEGK